MAEFGPRDVQTSDELRQGQCQKFLINPFAEQESEAIPVPNTPLLSEIFPRNIREWPSKVVFKAWKQPQKQWKQWVHRLTPKFSTIWTEMGIYKAITNTASEEFKYNSDLVLGLSQFWCPETNTFIFPWGEATVTLHDVMVLTGLPVVGDSVTSQISDESVNAIVEELEKQRIRMNKTKSKKPSYGEWIKHFMEEETDYEHAGFLTFWLSRFVFPSLPDQTIQKNLFPIAANLSVGKPMALGTSLLASVYNDLTKIYNETVCRKDTIHVVAPFQLLELWLQEYFPVLMKGYRFDSNYALVLDLPFVKSVPPVIRKVLEDRDQFVWQPFRYRMESFLKEHEQFLLLDSSSLDLDLRSFLRCLQCTDLVGLNCKEKYSPQRVAMQFGMDQDLPAQGFQSHPCGENIGFIFPPRSYQAGFSERYLKWWKQMMVARRGLKLEGRYAMFSDFLKKHWIDTHLHCSDSSGSSDESEDDLIETLHGNHESTSNMNAEELVDDNSMGTMDVTAGERILLEKRVPGTPDENVEVNNGKEVEEEVVKDICKGSESTHAAKRKKVGELS